MRGVNDARRAARGSQRALAARSGDGGSVVRQLVARVPVVGGASVPIANWELI